MVFVPATTTRPAVPCAACSAVRVCAARSVSAAFFSAVVCVFTRLRATTLPSLAFITSISACLASAPASASAAPASFRASACACSSRPSAVSEPFLVIAPTTSFALPFTESIRPLRASSALAGIFCLAVLAHVRPLSTSDQNLVALAAAPSSDRFPAGAKRTRYRMCPAPRSCYPPTGALNRPHDITIRSLSRSRSTKASGQRLRIFKISADI
ncbi:MAG: hypothetical protein JWR48_6455 [Mycobacterium sp.]|jgi:hypothetical protein|nr:hypothetical protein [Mycobacterium sp.]